jgi:signal transduction histidine kinase
MPPTFFGTHDYFATQRRTLRALLVAAIVFPAAVLSFWAWFSMQDAFSEAEQQTARLARVIQEHTWQVFDGNYQINSRVREVTQGMSDAQLAQHEHDIHVRLADISGGVVHASSLSIFGADGTLLASSRFYPVPKVNIRDREDYKAIAIDKQPFHVSEVVTGRVISERIFNASMPRLGANKEVIGIVSVSLRPAYFTGFYKDVLSQDRLATAALVRRDGAVLAAYPTSTPAIASAAIVERLQHAYGRESDAVLRTSSVAGEDSVVAHRAVGTGVLNAVVSIPVSAIHAQWRQRLYVAAAIAAVPSFALWALMWMSLRRLTREEEAYCRWQEEVNKRQEVEERYRQSRKLEAIGQLIASVAHDFRNVLSVISFNTDLMILRPNAPREKPLAGIKKGLSSGVALTSQLLGMARKREYRKEVLRIAQELDGWTPLIRSTLGSRIQLRYDIAADCWEILADRAELELALLNLASNARDAMPDGGLFEVSASNVRLDGHGPQGLEGDYVCISARDTGRGIPLDLVERVFEPLFTTKTAGLGTGLGLSQVREFCHECNGVALIASRPGNGTDVRLYLPPAPGSELAFTAGARRPRAAARTGASVMIVAESLSTVAGAIESLEGAGHEVVLASDANNALAVADQHGVDLVLADARLGTESGGAALRERLRRRFPFLPVILMADETDLFAMSSTSGWPFLLKPWNVQTLYKAGILVSPTSRGERQSARPGAQA